MKNLKFGAFFLGLVVVVATLVTGVKAQSRERNFMVLDGRGSELGAMVSDVDVKSATPGVKVDEVHSDSPAEKAGLRAGDIVVDYDGERVRSARQFTRLVQETPEGRSVAIGIMRDGKKQTVNATPEAGRMTWNFGPDVDRALREAERGMRNFHFEIPPDFHEFRFDDRDRDNREPRRFEYRVPQEFRVPVPGYGFGRGRLGVTVQSLTDELEEFFGAKNGGALVSSVSRDSAAAKAGIKAGDVIVSINGNAVSDSGDLMNALEDITGEATIVVLRDKKEMTLKATIDR
jgi:serine protease Do